MRVAWAGLDAPENVNDIYGYGLSRIENFVPFADYEDDVNALKFKGDYKKISCWTYDDNHNQEKCASEDEIKKLLNDNELLIERYKSLYTYDVFGWGDISLYPAKGELLIKLNNLRNAGHVIDVVNGHGDQAIALWI